VNGSVAIARLNSEAGSHSWTSNRVYEELSDHLHVQAVLFPGRRSGLLSRRLGGPQSRSGLLEKDTLVVIFSFLFDVECAEKLNDYAL